jgi:enoyl-CoA hydratase/carnithine racemase
MTPFSVVVDDAGFGVLTLEQPGKPVVVLDADLVARLDATLSALPAGLKGLVLASASERAFVAGADLKAIADLSDTDLHAYLQRTARVFARISALPYPTIAAINGAALGGGLELAMHCDALAGAPSPSGKPYPVGLPEAGLAICPGWGGTNLLPCRVDPAEAIRRTALGLPFTFDHACLMGLFDVIAKTPAELLPTAKSWLRLASFAKLPTRDGAPSRHLGRRAWAAGVELGLDAVRGRLPKSDPAAAVVLAVETGLSRGWEAALTVERERLVALRSLPAGKDAIAAFFAKSAGKK